MSRIANLPIVGSKKQIENVNRLKRLLVKMELIQKTFWFFMSTEWIYESKIGPLIWKKMSAKE